MEIFLSVLCILIVSIAGFALVIVYNQKKIEVLEVRTEEALKNIDYFLAKKQEILEKSIPLIVDSNKRKYGKKEMMETLIKNKNIRRDFYQRDNDLRENLKEFYQIIDDDEKLKETKEIKELYYQTIEIENDLNASKKYFNKILNKIEKEFNKFPRKFLKKVLKYQQREKFNTKKEATLEILKENAPSK